MLEINVPEVELFDEKSSTFFTSPAFTLVMEHSLVSLSKWESIHGKPFLDGAKKTTEETRSYIICMNLSPDVDQKNLGRLTNADIEAIAAYIDSKQTATWFKEDPAARRPTSEIITNEIIYYWMIAHSIPFEAQYWHLNKLLTLIKVCNEKNKPAKRSKMGTREQATSRSMLNAQRKAQLGTTG